MKKGVKDKQAAPTRRRPRRTSKVHPATPESDSAVPSNSAHARRSPARDSPSRSPAHDSPGGEPGALPSTRYLFFGGKGGVGKTTSACAAALLLLDEAQAGEQLLLFSTDPAHSLSDSLGVEVGDRTVEVARRGRAGGGARLFAREMDAARALSEFKDRHRAVLREIADRGTVLDEADINSLLDLSLPGMDEVMSLFELSEVERAGRYARVVVDTAPSGHTSRMLRLPEVFTRWVRALDLMSEKHRYLVAQFGRGRRAREDEVDLFLRELSERIRAVRAMLFDEKAASFTLVAIPEALSVEETRDYFRLLKAEGIPASDLLINRVEREQTGCAFCRARVRSQRPHLSALERDFEGLRTRRVPLMAEEVRGLAALRRFARAAWQAEGEGGKGEKGGRLKGEEVNQPARPLSPSPGFLLSPRRLLIFGGKGGVGKTTAAASVALAVAGGDASARVLVFSTDPAHSLSDSFGEEVGALRRGVAGVKNLDAMEIDPGARFEELKGRYRAWTDEMFDGLTGGSRLQIQFDREAMRELIALAPPGVDEIAALSAVSDLLDAETYTTIVLDTAPTGHLLRFLELPDIALAWVHTFIKLLLKYRNVVRFTGGVAEELVALSKSIKRVSALLTDARECEFVGVSIPERMGLEETARLAGSLERLKVPLSRVLVNNVVPAGAASACDFCAARQRSQRRVLRDFRKRFRGVAELFVAPQQPHEVQGAERLREHFASWGKLESVES